MARTHVLLPDDVVEEIDRLVGKRRRSQFLAEAAREKLEKIELLRALDETAGIFENEMISGWETAESTSKWLAESRSLDQDRLSHLRDNG